MILPPEIRTAFQQWIIQHSPSVFMTVAFNLERTAGARGWNPNVIQAVAERVMKHGRDRIDRKLLGPRAMQKPEAERSVWLPFAEEPELHFHYHAFVRPAKDRTSRFVEVAPGIMKALCPSASIDVRELKTDLDRTKAAWYATKRIRRAENYDAFLVL